MTPLDDWFSQTIFLRQRQRIRFGGLGFVSGVPAHPQSVFKKVIDPVECARFRSAGNDQVGHHGFHVISLFPECFLVGRHAQFTGDRPAAQQNHGRLCDAGDLLYRQGYPRACLEKILKFFRCMFFGRAGAFLKRDLVGADAVLNQDVGIIGKSGKGLQNRHKGCNNGTGNVNVLL
ncbi:MAG: hypothetical protein BWX80_04238 [Candidatus Hydrogenedentes bacterium ADurb.Bin101]|nr:MAG: hypothetical protein BWX80_04238 [Candidatus Hydrogenedentes bacterium ADurb.Bin101]